MYIMVFLSELMTMTEKTFGILIGFGSSSAAWAMVILAIIKTNKKNLKSKLKEKLDVIEFESYKEKRELIDGETTQSITNLTDNLKSYHREVTKSNEKILNKIDNIEEKYQKGLEKNRTDFEIKLRDHRIEMHK